MEIVEQRLVTFPMHNSLGANLGKVVVPANNFAVIIPKEVECGFEEITKDSGEIVPLFHLVNTTGQIKYSGQMPEKAYKNTIGTYYALSDDALQQAPESIRTEDRIDPLYVRALAYCAIVQGVVKLNNTDGAEYIPPQPARQ